jgi:hypothetical protein
MQEEKQVRCVDYIFSGIDAYFIRAEHWKTRGLPAC